jgi:hypothetical protein
VGCLRTAVILGSIRLDGLGRLEDQALTWAVATSLAFSIPAILAAWADSPRRRRRRPWQHGEVSGRAQLVVLVLVGVFLVGALQVLRWTGDEIADLEFTLPVPSEAGEVLDPASAGWLDSTPERTLVDPAVLRTALSGLDEQLAAILSYRRDGDPSPVTTRAQVPVGWNETDNVTVLIGARQLATIPTPADRELFVSELIRPLAAAGWRLTTTSRAAIQTTYPIVSPGPVDILVEGESRLGILSIVAPNEGPYRLTFSVGVEQGR